jgi:hypothetical protein
MSIAIAGTPRHPFEGNVVADQLDSRAVKPQPAHGIRHRFTGRFPVDAVEMPGREMRDRRERLDVELRIEMFGYVLGHARDASAVIEACLALVHRAAPDAGTLALAD